jgi:excisionase family DNA binding protein
VLQLHDTEIRHWYRFAGLRIGSAIDLDGLTVGAEPGAADVLIVHAGRAWMDDFARTTTHLLAIGEVGSPWMEVRRGNGGYLARWPEQLDVMIPDDGSRLHVLRRGEVPDSIPRLLLCQALSFALAAHGRETMHASAVDVGGRAIVVSGDSGRGKSTLATALCANGGRLLADDLVSIRFDGDGRLVVDPTSTKTWLAHELAALMVGRDASESQSDRVHKVAIGAGDAATEAVPLGAVYLVRYHGGEPLLSEPLDSGLAVKAFLGAMFNNVIRTPERLETQFRVATEIAAGVPIRILRWEPGPDAARHVAAQILEDLDGGRNGSRLGKLNVVPMPTRADDEASERRRLVEALRAAGVHDVPDDEYDEPLLRTSQVAALLRSSDRTIRTWADAGKLTYIKTLGGRRMFPVSAVMAVLRTMRAQAEEA